MCCVQKESAEQEKLHSGMPMALPAQEDLTTVANTDLMVELNNFCC